jgi:hypothetical protein
MDATDGISVNSSAAVRALRHGAARGLAAVMQARHPDLLFEVTVPGDEVERGLEEDITGRSADDGAD